MFHTPAPCFFGILMAAALAVARENTNTQYAVRNTLYRYLSQLLWNASQRDNPVIFKNLFRRKGRTLLALLGISIGVAAIIGLGALADGIESGYNALLTGSKADLVISQPNTLDISMSSVDESVGPEVAAMSEVAAISGMLEGFVQVENIPIFFIFGYPEDSFILKRFQILEGVSLDSREVQRARGKPILLGSSSANTLNKSPGDSMHVGTSVYRIVGIYETGDPLEDSGAILGLQDAQELLGKLRQVSLFYIQLKDLSLRDRVEKRVARLWPDLAISSAEDYADKQIMGDMLKGYVWAIAGLAIVIGGVGMMNAQLMSVMERTREIGVLRAVGWRRWRILLMLLGEAMLVGILGGLLGIGIAWGMLAAYADFAGAFGATTANISPAILQQAFVVVIVLGLVGGVYPAWRASKLAPIEALRYEGGSSGKKQRRLPIGGMAVQSLWQRTSRTALTLGVIGLTVGGIMSLEGIVRGMTGTFDQFLGGDAEILIRQADVADTSLSAIDEQVGKKIAALPEVESVSGMVISVATMPEAPMFLLLGYAPSEYAIQRFKLLDGTRLTNNHQIMLGNMMAESMEKEVGDTLIINESRYKIVGIYDAGKSWEEMGGIISLRDAQVYAGRLHKVTIYSVKLYDSSQAEAVSTHINQTFPDAYAALAGDFVEQMPDMENMDAMMAGISFLSIAVGGVGVMNTMLMAVLERTREIGVLRALGWRRRAILGLIVREALLLGLLGGIAGIGIAFGLVYLMQQAPLVGEMLTPTWSLDIFTRALSVALTLGLLGGLYPAFRATRLAPIEALRYE